MMSSGSRRLLRYFSVVSVLTAILLAGAFQKYFLVAEHNGAVWAAYRYARATGRATVGRPYLVRESLINDATLPWNVSVPRPWLDTDLSESEHPPAMLLLTTDGWNQLDREAGLKVGRHKRETEIYTAVVNHPWFHPTAWDDIEHRNGSIFPGVRYYVFIDQPHGYDSHYPIYGGYDENLDTSWNRSVSKDHIRFPHVPSLKALQGRLFRENRNATLLFFDTGGLGLAPGYRKKTLGLPVSFVTLSSLISRVDESVDQGFIPPAPKPAPLSPSEVEDVASCTAEYNRPFHTVYLGNLRSGHNPNFGARVRFHPFHDDNHTFVVRHFLPELNRSTLRHYSFEDRMRKTIFALVPRGDNKFSYKFTEVLSAGAIPVVLADDWVWPFRPELVDWTECAVILRESSAGKEALNFLENIPVAERCRMRQKCYEIYKSYVETPTATVRGIIEGMELVAKGMRRPMIGVRCINTTHGDPDCNLER